MPPPLPALGDTFGSATHDSLVVLAARVELLLAKLEEAAADSPVDILKIADTIEQFHQRRFGDLLWAGGLICAMLVAIVGILVPIVTTYYQRRIWEKDLEKMEERIRDQYKEAEEKLEAETDRLLAGVSLVAADVHKDAGRIGRIKGRYGESGVGLTISM